VLPCRYCFTASTVSWQGLARVDRQGPADGP
jgi:hypothetical protein